MREVNNFQQLSRELAEMARRAKESEWKGEREHTQLPAGGQVAPPGGAERAEFFSRLRVPMQSGTGDPKKAWPGGMPPEMAARAAEIVEDKRRRDREKASAHGKAK
jgi:hypothetical protein